MNPQTFLSNLEQQPGLTGAESFEGFAILGVSFRSGHTLAFRSFAHSSVGPAFSAVWMREPGGDWRIFSTAPASASDANYLRPALFDQVEVREEWLDPWTLRVSIPAIRMEWVSEFAESRSSSLVSAVISRMPAFVVRSAPGAGLISRVAGRLLHAGKLRLRGMVPNGQRFMLRPDAIWEVRASEAQIGDFHLGDVVTPRSQQRRADFWIPVRPIAIAGSVEFRRVRESVTEPLPRAANASR
ncbi:MAG: hypothetical protein AB7N24_02205 [Dehalococcoidia bacterium]